VAGLRLWLAKLLCGSAKLCAGSTMQSNRLLGARGGDYDDADQNE